VYPVPDVLAAEVGLTLSQLPPLVDNEVYEIGAVEEFKTRFAVTEVVAPWVTDGIVTGDGEPVTEKVFELPVAVTKGVPAVFGSATMLYVCVELFCGSVVETLPVTATWPLRLAGMAVNRSLPVRLIVALLTMTRVALQVERLRVSALETLLVIVIEVVQVWVTGRGPSFDFKVTVIPE
jgi:hypothetical protein